MLCCDRGAHILASIVSVAAEQCIEIRVQLLMTVPPSPRLVATATWQPCETEILCDMNFDGPEYFPVPVPFSILNSTIAYVCACVRSVPFRSAARSLAQCFEFKYMMMIPPCLHLSELRFADDADRRSRARDGPS